jgi:hypothetical protein
MSKLQTLSIAGQEWPVRWDFTAIRRTLPLAGLKRMTEADQIGQELPFEAIPQFIRNVVLSGLARNKDKREAPSLDEIEDALNDDMSLARTAIETVMSDSIDETAEPEEKATKGGAKGKK